MTGKASEEVVSGTVVPGGGHYQWFGGSCWGVGESLIGDLSYESCKTVRGMPTAAIKSLACETYCVPAATGVVLLGVTGSGVRRQCAAEEWGDSFREIVLSVPLQGQRHTSPTAERHQGMSGCPGTSNCHQVQRSTRTPSLMESRHVS